MKPYKVLLALALPLAVAPGVAKPPVAADMARSRLCHPGEAVIFACNIGAKLAAVCGGKSPSGARCAQYRYGVPGKLELTYPGDGASGGLAHAETAYSGGGESQILFKNAGFQYVVYSRMVRTNFKANEPNNPAFEAGVAVMKGDKLVGNRKCANPSDVDVDVAAASKFMPEGEFIYTP